MKTEEKIDLQDQSKPHNFSKTIQNLFQPLVTDTIPSLNVKLDFKTQDKSWSGKTTAEIPRKFEVQREIHVNHDSVPFFQQKGLEFQCEPFKIQLRRQRI